MPNVRVFSGKTLKKPGIHGGRTVTNRIPSSFSFSNADKNSPAVSNERYVPVHMLLPLASWFHRENSWITVCDTCDYMLHAASNSTQPGIAS